MLASLILAAFALAASPADTTRGAEGAAGTGTVLGRAPESHTGEEAAAPLDTLGRVPGTPFRLGWSPERVAAVGPFRLVSTAGATVTREGETGWFGAPARATLVFQHGRLARVHMMMSNAPEHLVSYAGDELRRNGYRRVGLTRLETGEQSEWIGRTRVSLTSGSSSLSGEFTPAPAPLPPPAPVVVRVDTLDLLDAQVAQRIGSPVRRSTPAPPERPAEAVSAGVYGRVTVAVLVDTGGTVVEASVQRSIPLLDATALAWARGVRFEPVRDGGHPACFRTFVPVLFLPATSPPAGKP